MITPQANFIEHSVLWTTGSPQGYFLQNVIKHRQMTVYRCIQMTFIKTSQYNFII